MSEDSGKEVLCGATPSDTREGFTAHGIFVPCPACDGSAVKVVGCMVYEPGCGFAHRDTDEIPCPECDGKGEVETEGRPITLEDLE